MTISAEDEERYVEVIDNAQKQQRRSEEQALQRVRANLAPETDPDFDGRHCVDGGELIPKARLAMGRIRCVKCQEIKERGSKLFRR